MTYPGHARALLTLGLPLIGGHLGQVAIGVTDTVMLGWYGIEALAAVTLAGSFFFLLFLMGSGFAWAVMPLVATFSAEGDERSVRRATRMGLWLSMIYACVVMPPMLLAEPIFLAFKQDPEIAANAASYLQVAAWGIFPALIVMVLKSYLAALERTQIVFWMTILAAVSNGLANYAFIFGNWGMPELGLTGAALASIVTQLVMLVGVILYATLVLPQHALFQNMLRPDWEMFSRVFRLGAPIGLTTLSEAGLFTGSALLMGRFGEVTLAAHGIALNIASVTFMLHLGLANAATIRAGNAIGRGDKSHLIRGARTALVLSALIAIVTIIIILIMPEALLSLFMERDAEAREAILQVGVTLLGLAALFQLVDGLQAVALGLLRGLQDTNAPMILAAVAYWLFGMPIAYVLGVSLGLEGPGVWLGMSAGLGMACILLNLRFWWYSVRRLDATLSARA